MTKSENSTFSSSSMKTLFFSHDSETQRNQQISESTMKKRVYFLKSSQWSWRYKLRKLKKNRKFQKFPINSVQISIENDGFVFTKITENTNFQNLIILSPAFYYELLNHFWYMWSLEMLPMIKSTLIQLTLVFIISKIINI